MTNRIVIGMLLATGLTAAACVASSADGVASAAATAAPDDARGERAMAKRANVGRRLYEASEIVARKSMPPQFDLLLTRSMPTPGWRFDVEVDVDEAARRVVATIRETPPDGLSAQVMTDATVRVPLGALRPGGWFVELLVGRDGEAPSPADAFVVHAHD